MLISRLFLTAVACAIIPLNAQNFGERIRNQASIATSKKEVARDTHELTDFEREIDSFATHLKDGDMVRATRSMVELEAMMQREIEQFVAKIKRAKSEQRSSRRELGSDRRELRKNRKEDADAWTNAGDRRDKRDDRRDYADDIADVETYESLKKRAKSLLASFSRNDLSADGNDSGLHRRTMDDLYAFKGLMQEDLRLSGVEIREDKKESREDRRETREDRRDR
ncbi:MAG: hypothetical protein MK080_10245 [Opitutales bacterium]|nr:hypothetical protein [Opitutales bacterium]NRA28090.1 hypothetical protein [Opitutales bacterium]